MAAEYDTEKWPIVRVHFGKWEDRPLNLLCFIPRMFGIPSPRGFDERLRLADDLVGAARLEDIVEIMQIPLLIAPAYFRVVRSGRAWMHIVEIEVMPIRHRL